MFTAYSEKYDYLVISSHLQKTFENDFAKAKNLVLEKGYPQGCIPRHINARAEDGDLYVKLASTYFKPFLSN